MPQIPTQLRFLFSPPATISRFPLLFFNNFVRLPIPILLPQFSIRLSIRLTTLFLTFRFILSPTIRRRLPTFTPQANSTRLERQSTYRPRRNINQCTSKFDQY